ncbi:hypothetical protein HY639_00750 [Candidatus Woesearchaeota archaeon]|nr:hypothetical protein [Candidatus Woesearchaeota archaeon]
MDQLSLDDVVFLATRLTNIQREENLFQKGPSGDGRKVITYRASYNDLYMSAFSHPYPGYDCMYEVVVQCGETTVAEYVLFYGPKAKDTRVRDAFLMLETTYKTEKGDRAEDAKEAIARARQLLKELA